MYSHNSPWRQSPNWIKISFFFSALTIILNYLLSLISNFILDNFILTRSVSRSINCFPFWLSKVTKIPHLLAKKIHIHIRNSVWPVKACSRSTNIRGHNFLSNVGYTTIIPVSPFSQNWVLLFLFILFLFTIPAMLPVPFFECTLALAK